MTEQTRESALHRLPVLDHVGNPGRAARVIFQHQISAIFVADEIGAANVNVNIARHIEVHELGPEMRCLPDDLFGNDTVAKNVLRVIDVVQKQIQRRDSLDESAFDEFPFFRGNDARHEIERKNALGPLVVVVDSKSDALREKGRGGQRAFAFEFFALHFLETRQ